MIRKVIPAALNGRATGFSMLEVMMAMGVASILLGGIATMNAMSARTNQSISAASAFNNQVAAITMALQRPDYCSNALSSALSNFSNGNFNTTTLSQLALPGGSNLASTSASDPTNSAGYQVSNITVTPFTQGNPNGYYPYVVYVNISANRTQPMQGQNQNQAPVGGAALRTASIPVSVVVTGGTTPSVSACSTATQVVTPNIVPSPGTYANCFPFSEMQTWTTNARTAPRPWNPQAESTDPTSGNYFIGTESTSEVPIPVISPVPLLAGHQYQILANVAAYGDNWVSGTSSGTKGVLSIGLDTGVSYGVIDWVGGLTDPVQDDLGKAQFAGWRSLNGGDVDFPASYFLPSWDQSNHGYSWWNFIYEMTASGYVAPTVNANLMIFMAVASQTGTPSKFMGLKNVLLSVMEVTSPYTCSAAVYTPPPGTTNLVCSSQRAGASLWGIFSNGANGDELIPTDVSGDCVVTDFNSSTDAHAFNGSAAHPATKKVACPANFTYSAGSDSIVSGTNVPTTITYSNPVCTVTDANGNPVTTGFTSASYQPSASTWGCEFTTTSNPGVAAGATYTTTCTYDLGTM